MRVTVKNTLSVFCATYSIFSFIGVFHRLKPDPKQQSPGPTQKSAPGEQETLHKEEKTPATQTHKNPNESPSGHPAATPLKHDSFRDEHPMMRHLTSHPRSLPRAHMHPMQTMHRTSRNNRQPQRQRRQNYRRQPATISGDDAHPAQPPSHALTLSWTGAASLGVGSLTCCLRCTAIHSEIEPNGFAVTVGAVKAIASCGLKIP